MKSWIKKRKKNKNKNKQKKKQKKKKQKNITSASSKFDPNKKKNVLEWEQEPAVCPGGRLESV